MLDGFAFADQPVRARPGHSASARVDVQLPARDHGTCRVRRIPHQRELCLELVGKPFVIVIEERYQIASRRRDTQVSRTGAANATRGAEDVIRQTGYLGGQFGAGFAVMDNDQFNARTTALRADTAQCSKELRSTDRGHDDANRGCWPAAEARLRIAQITFSRFAV